MIPTKPPSRSQGAHTTGHPHSQVPLAASLPLPVQLGPGGFPIHVPGKSCRFYQFPFYFLPLCSAHPRQAAQKGGRFFSFWSLLPIRLPPRIVLPAFKEDTHHWVGSTWLCFGACYSVFPCWLGTSWKWKEMVSHGTGFPQCLGALVPPERGNFTQKLQWVGISWLGEISWALAPPWLAWVGTSQPAQGCLYLYRLPPHPHPVCQNR